MHPKLLSKNPLTGNALAVAGVPDLPVADGFEGAQLAEDRVDVHVLRVLQVGHGESIAVDPGGRYLGVQRSQVCGRVDGVQALEQRGNLNIGRDTSREAGA